jgi:hypothetical protein
MNPIYTFNDTSIEIQIIEKDCYYKATIPNNDINKKLIENPKSNFKFEKSGTQTIIMHDDVHVFQLSKMECKYSEFIEIKNKLENTEKELLLLKNKIDNTECIMTVLQQQVLKKLINNEHLMQQQMKFYYDKETEQMKVCEDLPYIIVRNVENIIEERILYEKSQLIWKESPCAKILDFLNNDNGIIKANARYQNYKLIYNTQLIIPSKKILKIWKIQKSGTKVTFLPVDIYTSGIHFVDNQRHTTIDNQRPINIFAYWYGDIEYKDDVPDDYNFKYIYDNINKF